MITQLILIALGAWAAMSHQRLNKIEDKLDGLRDQIDRLDERLEEVCDA